MLLLLGGQVWLILEFNTEKPSVVTYLNHILQNHFDQNLRWFLYYLSLLRLSSFKIHLHGDNYSHYHVIKTPAVLKSLCFKYKNWFWYVTCLISPIHDGFYLRIKQKSFSKIQNHNKKQLTTQIYLDYQEFCWNVFHIPESYRYYQPSMLCLGQIPGHWLSFKSW